jgi:hypothetical protein
MTRRQENQLLLGGFAGLTDPDLDLNSSTVSVPPGTGVVLDGDYDPAFMHFFGANLITGF